MSPTERRRRLPTPVEAARARAVSQGHAGARVDVDLGEWLGAKRSAVCGRCSDVFVQRELTARFRAMAPAAIRAVIPDGWVPMHCPPCESLLLRQGSTLQHTAGLDRRAVDDERAGMADE